MYRGEKKETKERKSNTRNGVPKQDTQNNKKKTIVSEPRTLGLMFLSLLLDLLAFTMILPLLPTMLDYYNKQEGRGNGLYAYMLKAIQSFQKLTGAPDRFTSVLFGGILGSMYSFLQFLTSPIVGSLSDAYGRKPMLLICLTGIAASHALWGCARTFSLFVIARIVGGLSKANVSLSMGVMSDASNESTRARGMALVGLAFSVGFIAGPLAGAWFATSDLSASPWGEKPALCALALSAANILVVLFFLPETLPKEKRVPILFSLSNAAHYVSPWHLLKFTAVNNVNKNQKKILKRIGLIYFLYLFVYSGLEFTLTFLTHHTFKYTAMQQGKMFLVIGLIMALLQGGAARRLSPKGAVIAAKGALVLTPFSFIGVALAAVENPILFSPLTWLWIGLILFAVSTSMAVSCLSALAASRAAAARGAALGALRALGALARAAGPLLASTLYWWYGAALTYAIGSVILIIPAVMLIRLEK